MRTSIAAALCMCLLSAGCLAGLPGATGPRGPPTPAGTPPTGAVSVSVADIDVESTANGSLRVVTIVRNDGSAAATRTVTATVTVDGDRHVRSTSVRVAGGGRTTARIEFDVAFDAFSDGGNVSVDVT